MRRCWYFALWALAAMVMVTPADASATQGPATDAAAAAGIGQVTQSIGATVGDLNGDGLPDMVLNRTFIASARVYINTGAGGFSEIDANTFPKDDRHGCAMADANGDGLEDIYCTVGASHGTAVKANELWIQQPGGTFVNETATMGAMDPYGRSRAAVFFDANGDGRPDLFVANYYPRPDGRPTPNRLFINQDGEGFVDAPELGLDQQVGGLALAPGCAQAADYDGDGYPDLLVCGAGGIHVYHNDADAGFTDATSSLGLSGVWLGATFADLNNDGRLDLVMIEKTGLQVRLQQSDGRFNVVSISRELVGGRALAVGDINADSYLDVYALQGASGSDGAANPPDIMYQNEGGTDLVQVPIPETSVGNGASVSEIDYNGDGIADFIVTNGARGVEGPVQLITFPPPATPPPSP
jgi:FG-GAP-like repeat